MVSRSVLNSLLVSLVFFSCIDNVFSKSNDPKSSARSSLNKLGGGSLYPAVSQQARAFARNNQDESNEDSLDQQEEDVDLLTKATYIAETNLPTDLGLFRLRAYRIPRTNNQHVGTEPCVIYAADKPPFGKDGKLAKDVPVRVHDQCFTSEVFRSQR